MRARTGAGMMECKKALEEAGGDAERAAQILRERGVLKAAARAERIAAEGIVAAAVSPDRRSGVLVEVNCETDFVGQSEAFVSFTDAVAAAALAEAPAVLADLLSVKLASGQSVAEAAPALSLTVGEKITVRRFHRLTASRGKIFSYRHGSRLGVLVELAGGTPELALDVALQVAASRPKCLDRSQVTAADLQSERELYAKQLREQGKPEAMIENIVRGKLEKFYGEVCLLDQPFIKEEKITIKQRLAQHQAEALQFARFELGEGIAKAEKDFASEVAAQLG